MAHPDTPEAVDASAQVTDESSATAALANLFGADVAEEEQEENSEAATEGKPVEGELEIAEDDEQEGEEDEPDEPAIVPPVSLNADEKAKFEQQPPEAQHLILAIEARRNTQVQEATTKASEAQRAADARAAIADAQAKANYAQQLKVFADALAPQMPDAALAQSDPATYVALRAQYDAALAQHDEFVQQVQALGQEAETTLTETEVAQRDRELLAIPEVQNEETRNAFFEKSIGAAKTLGLDLSGLNSATAKEWQALRQVSDAFEKASKYDAAMARQMQRVREGKKGKPARPNAAQPLGAKDQRFSQSVQRLRETGSVDDAATALRNILG
jgi:hypothetical protein